MINIKLSGHDRKYDVESVLLLFFPREKFDYTQNDSENISVISSLYEKNGCYVCKSSIKYGNKKYISVSKRIITKPDSLRTVIKSSLYSSAVKLAGITPKWGMLTGIRPIKLTNEIHLQNKSYYKTQKQLQTLYKVSSEKALLCIETLKNQKTLNLYSSNNDVSLYIAIPFCPTRCKYCSFVSHSIENAKDILSTYINLLCIELEKSAHLFKNKTLRTIYIGGGTPTTMSVEMINRLFDTLKSNYDLSNVIEFTCEAGRPDTFTKEKLEALKNMGVTRISINPQVLNDETLRNLGRNHTVSDIENAFSLAYDAGFEHINADLIAGADFNLENFKYSVDRLIRLGADNITIHSLTVKHGASYAENDMSQIFSAANKTGIINQMHQYAYNKLKENGYFPYYLYRQKNTLENLENTGYSKKHSECIYNIIMMDETHSVISFGAGAVTKIIKYEDTQKISRVFNPKYPYEYIKNFDKVLQSKPEIENLL